MAWPKERRLIGKKHSRIDGPAKASGTAKYSYDINRPGMLHGAILRCPYAHAKLKSLDTAAAEEMPGVKAVHIIAKPGTELYFAGDLVVGIAADTEEHARDALRAVKADYDQLDFFVKEEDALKAPDKGTVPGAKPGNVRVAGQSKEGDADAAFGAADAVHEGEYGVPVISHQCLESHGSVAEWDKDGNLTIWASTQATAGVAGQLRGMFGLQPGQVKCITHFMGGGFGSKFVADAWDIAACHLAKKAGAAVKMMLDRADEITTAGNRPSAYGTIKIAGTKEGKITAYAVDCHGTPGVGGGQTVNLGLLPYPYQLSRAIPNVQRKHTIARLNIGSNRAMRAPGHPQNCVLTEGAVDDLAAKLGIDPMQLRLKNLPQNDANAAKNSAQSYAALRGSIYEEEIKIAAKLAEWDKKWHKPGEGNGPIKHGIGMAMHTWGGAAATPNQITVTIHSDGSVLLESSTQDLGTGEKTVLSIAAAEALGLEVKDITIRVGESPFGPSSGSGGSTTCPGTAPLAYNAGEAARNDLFQKLAGKLGAKEDDLSVKDGKIVDKAKNKSWTWKEACARLGTMDTAKGQAKSPPVPAGMTNNGVGGVQIAEVKVDTETGVVRCTKVVAVQDCGMVINKLCCESQVAGGVIMGVNYALFEECIFDNRTGRQVNPDMEFYKLGGIQDMPHVIVHMHDMPDRGVIGIGEPPTISTCAAVGNAVFNAIGVRVPFAPYTPERVLAALAQKKGGKG